MSVGALSWVYSGGCYERTFASPYPKCCLIGFPDIVIKELEKSDLCEWKHVLLPGSFICFSVCKSEGQPSEEALGALTLQIDLATGEGGQTARYTYILPCDN